VGAFAAIDGIEGQANDDGVISPEEAVTALIGLREAMESGSEGESSPYDFNKDGKVDGADSDIFDNVIAEFADPVAQSWVKTFKAIDNQPADGVISPKEAVMAWVGLLEAILSFIPDGSGPFDFNSNGITAAEDVLTFYNILTNFGDAEARAWVGAFAAIDGIEGQANDDGVISPEEAVTALIGLREAMSRHLRRPLFRCC